MTNVSAVLNIIHVDESNNFCDIIVSIGLLELLSLVVVSTPTSHLRGVLDVVLKPEVLLVMANHPAPQIRTAVVKVRDRNLSATSFQINDKTINIDKSL